MSFWLGLEILRLVYKKAFLEKSNGFYCIIFDLLSSRNISIALLKSWKKNFFKIVCKMYQKKHNFALVSKKVQNSCVLQEALVAQCVKGLLHR